MQQNDAQVGIPGTVYKNAQATIEALTSPVEGMLVESLDTHQLGFFNGDSWVWWGMPSGTTLPTTPYQGQTFLHTPTGRKVLMQYVGTTWYPLYNMGTMTVYVDGTDGTDAADKGFGVDADAYKTLTYAWSQIPSTFLGSVVVNVAAGTYAELLNCTGKMAGNPGVSITIQGALSTIDSGSVTSAVQGTGATEGSVTDTGKTYTTDEHKGRFIVTNAGTRVIKSNTADTLYIVSTFTSTPTGAFTIQEPATIIDGGGVRAQCVVVQNYQTVALKYLKIGGASQIDIYPIKFSVARFSYCMFTPALNKYIMQSYSSNVIIEYCSAIHNGSTYWYLYGLANVTFWGCVCYQSVGTKSGICMILVQNSFALLNIANDLSNFSTAISAAEGSCVSTATATANGYNFIHDNTTGISAATNAHVTGTANNQYVGNTTNESAAAATFASID